MNNHNTAATNRIARIAASFTLFLACVAIPAHAQGLAQSCAEIKAANPAAVDDEYVLSPGGNTFLAYCHDMAGSPREYLSLVNTGGAYNYSAYGYLANWWDPKVYTHYTRVRIDPATLRVDIADQTFATSTGIQCCIGPTPVTSMPYANAASCNGTHDGDANVNLVGTPFAVNDTFTLDGWYPSGSVNGSFMFWGQTLAAFAQVVNLTGGGSCGGLGPNPGGNINTDGGFDLQLAYTGGFSVDKESCKAGGFAAFGVFRNQGDCVSYFATKGRNGPR